MRVKAKPDPEPKTHPFRLDLSDLEALLNEFPGATLVLETKGAIFEGLDDIEHNLHALAEIEQLDLVFPNDDKEASDHELRLVPRVSGSYRWRERTELEARAKEFLRNFHRPDRKGWLIGSAAALMLVLSVLSAVLDSLHLKAANAIGVAFVVVMVASFAAIVSAPLRTENTIIPRRKQASLFRRHGPSWIGAAVLAVFTAVVGVIVTRLFS